MTRLRDVYADTDRSARSTDLPRTGVLGVIPESAFRAWFAWQMLRMQLATAREEF